MSYLQIVLLGVLVTLARGDDDRNYCSAMAIVNEAMATGDKVFAAQLQGHGKTNSEIIEFLAAGAGINAIMGSSAGGIFPSSEIQADAGAFCISGGKLFIADINADTHDDLLCKSSAGTFTYRLYTSGGTFSTTVETVSDFTCATANNVLIGDFNNDHFDDIMCYDPAQTAAVGAESSIYFGGRCQNYYPYHYRRYLYRSRRRSYGYPSHSRWGRHATQCTQSTYTFSANAIDCIPNADIMVVADVDGNGRDDLVCRVDDDNSIKYYLSTGSRTGTVFGAATAIAAATCPSATDTIIAADVDGDSDSDLVCVNKEASATAETYSISYFSGGTYLAFAPPAAGSNCIVNVCRDGSTASPVSYQVGDFNGDGAEDYMCRYEDATPQGIVNIVYSVPA